MLFVPYIDVDARSLQFRTKHAAPPGEVVELDNAEPSVKMLRSAGLMLTDTLLLCVEMLCDMLCLMVE